MQWWREARFGMFIHWGLYSVPAGRWNGKTVDGASEWLINDARIKAAEYEPLQKQFNPVKFDAKEWVRIAKAAGVKYITITSKHHEGFAMWDTKQTDWSITNTPYGKDVLKQLAAACKGSGIRLCFYHSIMDWHNPDYLPRREWDPRPDQKGDYDKYVAFMKAQLKELLTGYGPIGVLWFDGEWEDTWTHDRGKDLYQYVRSLQPDIIVNNRVDTGRSGRGLSGSDDEPAGDFGTPEQTIPANGLPGVDWESCMTMNDSWGYKADDHGWKSSEQLIRNLVDIASKGGNYLLNVGPTSEGLIPPESVERLKAMGAWLKVNGDAIYGTEAGPFTRPQPGWRVTQRPGKLYVHVFSAPDGAVILRGLQSPVKRAYMLADKSRATVRTESTPDGVTITAAAARSSGIRCGPGDQRQAVRSRHTHNPGGRRNCLAESVGRRHHGVCAIRSGQRLHRILDRGRLNGIVEIRREGAGHVQDLYRPGVRVRTGRQRVSGIGWRFQREGRREGYRKLGFVHDGGPG
jgi:alpha-L-fucosidase